MSVSVVTGGTMRNWLAVPVAAALGAIIGLLPHSDMSRAVLAILPGLLAAVAAACAVIVLRGRPLRRLR